MRIIAGAAKGRRLVSPRGSRTRPTSDRVREAIFSIVGDLVLEARVMDLYAGTGAMGLEALSRGAREAVFVESGADALRCLRANVETCRYQDRSQIVSQQVIRYLDRAENLLIPELVFVDPPYTGDLGTLTLKAISKHATPSERCLIVLEHAPESPPGPLSPEMDTLDTRKYGNTGVTFLAFRNIQGA